MAKGTKQESRKTVWRGISVKAETRPTSSQSQDSSRTSVSWERAPLSPLAQQDYNTGIKTPPDTPKPEDHQSHQPSVMEDQQQTTSTSSSISPSNSTTVVSTKSSSRSSHHKKERLAGLGSLTKTVEPSQHKKKDSKSTFGSLTKSYQQNDKRALKDLERKERKEREKLERQERKDQEKLDKERKEQQKKELKLLKEKERKDRKSKTKSSLFSRSGKSSSSASPPTIETANSYVTVEDKPKSPVERRSLLSFGRHSLASLASRPSNASTSDVVAVVPETAQNPIEEPDSDDSGSEEFVDFVDSQMSIHSAHSNHSDYSSQSKHSKISVTLAQQDTATIMDSQTPPSPSSPTSPLHPRPQSRTPKLLEHLQQQAHLLSSRHSTSSSISSITSSNSKNSNSTAPSNANHSMLFILNSLQDAGRDIEDDDLLDDLTENKMEEAQRQSRLSISHQRSSSQGHQQELDQHIRALEIIANRTSASPPPTDPLPPIPVEQRTHRHTRSFNDNSNRFSIDSYHSTHLQQHQYSPSGLDSTSPRMSHCSSVSNSSYDTVSQTESHLPSNNAIQSDPQQPTPMAPHYEITAITEEDLIGTTSSPAKPGLQSETGTHEGQVLSGIDEPSGDLDGDDDSSSSFISADIADAFLDPPDNESIALSEKEDALHVELTLEDDKMDQHHAAHSPANDAKAAEPQPTTTISDTETTDNYETIIKAETRSTDDIEQKTESPTDQDTSFNIEVVHPAIESKEIDETTKPPPSTSNDDLLHEAVIEEKEVKLVESTETSQHHKPPALQITTFHAPPSSPTPTMDKSTNHRPTSPMDRPISSAFDYSPSSPIAAAAAVTASKRSSFMSTAKRSSTHSLSTPLERHIPAYLESPSTHLNTTSTPLSGSSSRTESVSNTPEGTGVAPNFLSPREQEDADQPIRQGMNYLFSNKFTKAMSIFKSKAESEPLHALGLGSMLFLKGNPTRTQKVINNIRLTTISSPTFVAMMTYNEHDVDGAMESLTHAYTIANTQSTLSEVQRSFDDTFSSHFSSLMATGDDDSGRSHTMAFKSNGVLRAQVIKAESCLLMGILQLTQETMTGYLKCGLNFRKACASYTFVWSEYQRMGDQVSQWMDQDTALAVQFGVGTLHLLLSSLPEKIVKIFPGLVWKTDRALGVTLLKSVMTGTGTRSSFGSLMLLSYYSLLSSSVPSIYAQESIQPTIECLVAAQKSHPKSCFFLYYAARISRVARNVGLSTQSFTMATTSTRKAAWAEVAMKHTVAYEVGLNHAMQLDWDTSAAYFEQLCCARDWSPAFCQYFVGACREMLGQRQEAKDAFDEVPVLSHQQHHRKSLLDNYVQCKVEQYQYHDYRDLDSSLPGLELLLLLNGFAAMEDTYLKRCLEMVQETCQLIKIGGMVDDDDTSDDDTTSASDYGSNNSKDNNTMMARYGTLLLVKCAVLNALSRHDACIPDLDWLLAKKHQLEGEEWLLPFVYWEAGVTYWGLENRQKSRSMWQLALSCTKYDFEFRMAGRIHLALAKCDELDGCATGRKRI